MNPDASTHENNDANTYFTSGKAAMVQMFPFVIKDFEKALGKNLGITRLPQSGPNPGRTAANSFHNWVIPKNAKNKDGAWEFIKMAVDNQGASAACDDGRGAADQQGGERKIKDPLTKFFLQMAAKPQVPLLDSIVPAEGRAALLPAAPGGVLGEGHGAAGDAERRQGPQVAEPLTASHGTDGSKEAPQPAVAVGPPLRGARGRCSWAPSSRIRSAASSTTPSRAGTASAPSEWVGVHNFRLLWDDPIFRNALEEQRDLRALGPDPARPAADRGVRDPPTRARLAAVPRDRLPARGLRDGRDRHPHGDGAPARRAVERGARRSRPRRAASGSGSAARARRSR